MHKFVQISVFSLRSARFVIFALGATLFSYFQQSARVCTKHRFQNEISTPVSFALGTPLFNFFSGKSSSLSKEQNSLISPRSARFIIFALCTPLISDFQQSARVCTKQRFKPEIRTFCHFRTGHTTFLAILNKVHEFVQNSVLSRSILLLGWGRGLLSSRSFAEA